MVVSECTEVTELSAHEPGSLSYPPTTQTDQQETLAGQTICWLTRIRVFPSEMVKSKDIQ